MGIKFYCPNGHKVNVKTFLAGKKGLCPKCGVRVDIPLQSVAQNQSASVASSGISTADNTDDLLDQISSGRSIATSLSLADDLPTIEETPHSRGPVLPAPQALTANGGLSTSPSAFADNSLISDDLLLPPISESVMQASAANAVWHVQFASGQRLGPVDDIVLQQWLGEGRISPDDLVWRDGWSNWQSAMAVFPQWKAYRQQPMHVSLDTPAAGSADNPLLEAVENSLPAPASNNWFNQRHRGKRVIRCIVLV